MVAWKIRTDFQVVRVVKSHGDKGSVAGDDDRHGVVEEAIGELHLLGDVQPAQDCLGAQVQSGFDDGVFHDGI